MILPASSSDSMPSLIKISYNSDESKFAKSSLLLMPLSPNLIIWDEFNSSKLIRSSESFNFSIASIILFCSLLTKLIALSFSS